MSRGASRHCDERRRPRRVHEPLVIAATHEESPRQRSDPNSRLEGVTGDVVQSLRAVCRVPESDEVDKPSSSRSTRRSSPGSVPSPRAPLTKRARCARRVGAASSITARRRVAAADEHASRRRRRSALRGLRRVRREVGEEPSATSSQPRPETPYTGPRRGRRRSSSTAGRVRAAARRSSRTPRRPCRRRSTTSGARSAGR